MQGITHQIKIIHIGYRFNMRDSIDTTRVKGLDRVTEKSRGKSITLFDTIKRIK
jgi:hypothetical protein